MSNRHFSRSTALQTLFEWDFHGRETDLASIAERLTSDALGGGADIEFVKDLVLGVEKNLPVIDQTIIQNAPEWPIEQIPLLDRNLLRLGLFELLFSENTPPKVVINEAVELAKSFGGDRTAKLVNGVLGSVYKSKYGIIDTAN